MFVPKFKGGGSLKKLNVCRKDYGKHLIGALFQPRHPVLTDLGIDIVVVFTQVW
jgi:hypothetical protein